MRTICLDFGNTRLKAAIFDDGHITNSIVLENDGIEQIREMLQFSKPEKSILSSVIHHNPEIEILLASATHFHKLNPKPWEQTDWHFQQQWSTFSLGKITW